MSVKTFTRDENPEQADAIDDLCDTIVSVAVTTMALKGIHPASAAMALCCRCLAMMDDLSLEGTKLFLEDMCNAERSRDIQERAANLLVSGYERATRGGGMVQ